MNPLVLLPGMNCTADLWTGCGFDAITPELDQSSVSAQLDRLLAEIPPLVTLVGLSLGGIVAMALAIRAPERVAGLCVVSTNAKAPTSGQRAGWEDWETRLKTGEAPRALQEEILPSLLSDSARQDAPLVSRVLAMGDGTGGARLRAQLQMQASREDLLPGLAQLRIPALVVSGASDVVCPPVFHVEIAKRIPRARMVTITAGHLLPMEQPEQFARVVSSWRTAHRL